VKKPLISEGDLSNIPKDTSYLFVSGMFPMKLEKAWQSEVFANYLDQFKQHEQVEKPEHVAETKIAATVEEETLAESPRSNSGGTTTRILEEERNQSEHLDLDFDEAELEPNESLTEEEHELEKEDIQKRLKEKEVTIQNFF